MPEEEDQEKSNSELKTTEDEGSSVSESDEKNSPNADEKYCSSCGEIIKKEAEICPECGVRQKEPEASKGEKDKVVAAILAFFLGGLGAHKFYLDEPGIGILYLCFSWTFIPSFVAMIEGIIYLAKSDEEFEQRYG